MAVSSFSRLLILGVTTSFLAACSYLPDMGGGEADYPTKTGKDRSSPTSSRGEGGGILGDLSWTLGDQPEEDVVDGEEKGGILGGLFGSSRRSGPSIQSVGLGVNAYLWRATLDTVSFLPLQSSDPVGGVVITDWYADPQSPRERFKLTVYILDRNLRADGVRVSAFRQQRQGNEWVDAAVNQDVAIKLENAILVRARQLKVSSGG